MPKPAASAGNQAKLAAAAILRALTNSDLDHARIANTCWSLIAEDDGVKVGNTFAPAGSRFIQTSASISRVDEHHSLRLMTAREAEGWYQHTVAEMFGA